MKTSDIIVEWLSLGIGFGSMAVCFASAYVFPHWKIFYLRSKVPMSIRGRIRTGILFAFWTFSFLVTQITQSRTIGYLCLAAFLPMIWWVSQTFKADKKANEASQKA